ncbi:FimV/HubP family polar landmark protein [Rhodanobacter aciditrophus]|uniref:FimV/HubP family polar landmark protein n=1 Tax=Rhodanobacter aciditrophus TaxID=1623218 RepID=A0ABW4B0G4_9GAMM
MLRKTLISMAVSGALYVSSSYALELGELTSQSAIDEPYRGRIQLTDADGLAPADITVRLGSESEFRQAGLAPSTILAQLNFSVIRENGQLAVLVQSQEPLEVQELQFVLAARWPSGQVVREYQTPINQSALVEKAQPEVIQSIQPQPAANPTNQVFRQETATANQMQTASELNVRKGNTLWSIAGANRPSNQLTIYQTMMAIQALNQDAFYANNINLLREGAVLRLPTQEQIALFNKATSQAEFERQHAAWMALKNAGRIDDVVNQEQLNTQAQSNTTPAPPAKTGDQLKLASGQSVLPEADASSNAADTQRISDLESELSATNELLDKETREKEELSDKLSDVNEQLATLERLISLKDQQMAELQRQFTSAQQALQEQKNTVDQLLEADQLRREQAAAEEESFSNKIFGNPIILSISGVVLLLLGLLAGMLIKRSGRKKEPEVKDTTEFDLAPAAAAATAGAAAVVATEAVAESEPEPEQQDYDVEEEDPFAFDFDVDNEADDGFDGFDESVASTQTEVTQPEEDGFDEFEIPELDETVSEPENESDELEDALGIEMDELADEEDEANDDPFAEFEIEDADAQDSTSEVDATKENNDFNLEDTLGDFESQSSELDIDNSQDEQVDDLSSEFELPEPEADDDQFSEEESFVSNLLNDEEPDQADSDESSVFDREPDAALAESIDEALAEAQQDEDDFGGLDVPEFGEEEAAAESDESDDEEEIDFFDASGDEVATKLDLARAYMDMGDEEGARVILEDVVASGNESQIAEAQSMMERMFPSE